MLVKDCETEFRCGLTRGDQKLNTFGLEAANCEWPAVLRRDRHTVPPMIFGYFPCRRPAYMCTDYEILAATDALDVASSFVTARAFCENRFGLFTRSHTTNIYF